MSQKLIKLFHETWFFWLYCICAGFLGGREPDAVPMQLRIGLLFNLVFALLVAVWVKADARRRQKPIDHDFPALGFCLWPIVAPIYLFQTRGVRAFLGLLAFLAMVFVITGLGLGISIMTRD